jgi:Xaa-Pro aminopeptidase
LRAAEARATELLDAIERAELIRAGRTERMVEDDIYTMAKECFGVEKHWHKRIVRAGPNTLTIASDRPLVRTIEPDDIVYVDLGPVFEAWEADIGRSYALGNDPAKAALVADLPVVFERVQAEFLASPEITGAELYAFAQAAAADAGWEFGGQIAGHLIAEFPHAYIPGDKDLNRIGPRNPKPVRGLDDLGQERHWILEIHLVDRRREFGGFYERLL